MLPYPRDRDSRKGHGIRLQQDAACRDGKPPPQNLVGHYPGSAVGVSGLAKGPRLKPPESLPVSWA